MTFGRLREVHRLPPFRPFSPHLADGGQTHILHPEPLAYSPLGRTIVVVAPDDTTQFVDLLLVSGIDMGDGKGRSGW